MRISICCPGRFWLADLGRELLAHGHDIDFHSYVPKDKLEPFGIPRKNQTCHLPIVAPFVLAQRQLKLPDSANNTLNSWTRRLLDRRYCSVGANSDVFIGMSGLCVKSLRAAKNRGSFVILERGSMHIEEQQRVLRSARIDPQITPETIERELAGYAIADKIVVPSRHVQQSFLSKGFSPEKIVLNQYGVNPAKFQPPSGQENIIKEFDVINTGTWCRRKGSDQLAKVVLEDLGLRLLHVGPVGDLELPSHSRFQHHPSVAQNELPKYYSKASVFALPSHEEGLAMIQAQALACGLPIVGSHNSGAADLAECLGIGSPRIQVVSPDSSDELGEAIIRALDWSKSDKNVTEKIDLEKISWKTYGDRYVRFLAEARIGAS